MGVRRQNIFAFHGPYRAKMILHTRFLARLRAACVLAPPVLAASAVCQAAGGGGDGASLYARRWVDAPNGGGGGGARLRVVQFNTLADGLSGRHPSNGGFTESPPASLDWAYRRGRLVAEIFRHFDGAGPDVVALQEVDHFEELEAEMRRRGFEGAFRVKPESPCLRYTEGELADGCALFWRSDAVTLDELTTLNYPWLGPTGEPTGQASNQVAIVAQMRLLRGAAKGGAPFVVAVSHLMARKDATGERARAQQVAQLLEAAFAAAQRAGTAAVVAMLDMNAAPARSAAADYEPEALPAALDGGRVRSAYAAALGDEPSYTSWKRRGAKDAKYTIDYVLVSPAVAVRRVLLPPDEDELDAERLPGWRYPSDHVALQAELEI